MSELLVKTLLLVLNRVNINFHGRNLLCRPFTVLFNSSILESKLLSLARIRSNLLATSLTVECFLEVILSIYRFKRGNFLFENGIVESKTCRQYGRHKSGQDAPKGIFRRNLNVASFVLIVCFADF